MAENNSPIILSRAEDWPNWIQSIRGSISTDIWPLIDPDAEVNEEPLEKPKLPTAKDVNDAKTTFRSLTSTERSEFEVLLKIYSAEIREYDSQHKGLTDAKILIQSRVSAGKNVLLLGNQSAREWLATLKEATKISKEYRMSQISDRYQDIVRKTPTRNTIIKWLSEWEKVMAEGIKHNIPEVSTGKWLRDLGHAISTISDGLSVMFLTEATDDTKTDPNRYLSVSAKINEVIRPIALRGRVTRGSTFATAEFDKEPAEEDPMETEESTQSRKRAGTNSALKTAPKEKKKKIPCKACGQIKHNLSRCFYAFPELRHHGFKPIESLVAKTIEALKDPDLAEEVEEIRKQREAKKAE
jgi:hypothetical protein